MSFEGTDDFIKHLLPDGHHLRIKVPSALDGDGVGGDNGGFNGVLVVLLVVLVEKLMLVILLVLKGMECGSYLEYATLTLIPPRYRHTERNDYGRSKHGNG